MIDSNSFWTEEVDAQDPATIMKRNELEEDLALS